MKKYFLLLSIVSLVLISSGCTSPWHNQQNSTQTSNNIAVDGAGDKNSSAKGSTVKVAAQNCANCGHYPWYKDSRCPECGYGDNDGILYCPNCEKYSFNGNTWASGYCTSCGYSAPQA